MTGTTLEITGVTSIITRYMMTTGTCSTRHGRISIANRINASIKTNMLSSIGIFLNTFYTLIPEIGNWKLEIREKSIADQAILIHQDQILSSINKCELPFFDFEGCFRFYIIKKQII